MHPVTGAVYMWVLINACYYAQHGSVRIIISNVYVKPIAADLNMFHPVYTKLTIHNKRTATSSTAAYLLIKRSVAFIFFFTYSYIL